MAQAMFLSGYGAFQDTEASKNTVHNIQDLFSEQEDNLYHLFWPPQLPELKLIELCGLHWIRICVVTNHCLYRFLNMPPVFRKKV